MILAAEAWSFGLGRQWNIIKELWSAAIVDPIILYIVSWHHVESNKSHLKNHYGNFYKKGVYNLSTFYIPQPSVHFIFKLLCYRRREIVHRAHYGKQHCLLPNRKNGWLWIVHMVLSSFPAQLTAKLSVITCTIYSTPLPKICYIRLQCRQIAIKLLIKKLWRNCPALSFTMVSLSLTTVGLLSQAVHNECQTPGQCSSYSMGNSNAAQSYQKGRDASSRKQIQSHIEHKELVGSM